MSPEVPPTRLTLHEVAERLGVHYMTAYRYVRTGRLPAERVGSRWSVDPADLALLRTDRTPPRGPGGAARPAAGDPGRQDGRDHAGRLEARLLVGDEIGAWAVLESAMVAGHDPAQVHLDVLAPALRSIGDGWVAGRVSVSDEHRASVVALRLVGRLGPRFVRRGRKRGTVVLGAAPGDLHAIPTALAADLLRARSFEVIDLGADVPSQSFLDAARAAERLVAVGIVATTPGNEGATAAAVAAVRSGVDCPVVVGGHGLDPDADLREIGADRVTTSATELLEAIGDLDRTRHLAS